MPHTRIKPLIQETIVPRIRPSTTTFARHLRHEMTDAERCLWQHLRQQQMYGVKFRRQHPVGRYILDFACLEKRLAIELDGGQHMENATKDAVRSAWLASQGWQVLRFWNNEVLSNTDAVLACIARALNLPGALKNLDEEPRYQVMQRDERDYQVSTPTLTLPLQGGGDMLTPDCTAPPLQEGGNEKITHCTALILAGGESRRMGRDKATLPLGEKTLLQHVADTLQPLFPHLLLSVRQPRPELAYPQICDTLENAGAMAGLLAGLAAAPTDWVFAVACDMPFLHPAVVRHLAAQRDGFQAVVPVVQGHEQPLAAFYHRSCLATFAQQPHGGMRKQLKNLAVCYVPDTALTPLDPALHSFFDLDTPQDWARAGVLSAT